MYTSSAAGGSKAFLVVFVLLALIAIIVFGGFFALKESRLSSASEFGDTFVKSLSEEGPDSVVDSLSDDLTATSSAYFEWVFWASSFSENGISISTPPQSERYIDESITEVVAGTSDIELIYMTSVDSRVKLTVNQRNGEWVVSSYASL